MDVKLFDRNTNEIMEIVRSLRKMGLTQGQDFDFAFVPAKWNFAAEEPEEPKYVKFTFYQEKWATMFSLKWQ